VLLQRSNDTNTTKMTYKQIETELKKNNFIHVSGANPLQGMTWKSESQVAIVFVEMNDGSIKHQVKYHDIIAEV
jgi:hypothetical protein